MRASAGRSALVALALFALGLAACGGERRFDAEGFVEEANEAGAGLALGERLGDPGEEPETYALRFVAGGDRDEAAGHGHGGGSLTITNDADAGRAEFERCERAVTLLCFRAANAVIILEGDYTTDDVERVTEAMRSLAGEA